MMKSHEHCPRDISGARRWAWLDILILLLPAPVVAGLLIIFEPLASMPLLVVIAVIVPCMAFAFVRLRQECRLAVAAHRCQSCGYDKSGLSRWERCPECGEKETLV
jgi:predicted RNA-binding Zn-ribbon protein involved in translation (DUF1610 family)